MKKLSKTTRKRRSFTPEFKAEAVRIARTAGRTVSVLRQPAPPIPKDSSFITGAGPSAPVGSSS